MRGTGGGAATSTGRADERRLLDEPVAQQPLGAEPVERVGRRAGPAVRRDLRHDVGQRLGRGDVAVDELERLTVVGADADLEPGDVEVGVDHRPAHLEPGHLAGEHAVLDDRLGAGRLDQRDEGQRAERSTGAGGGSGAGLGRGAGRGPSTRHTVRRVAEQRGAAGQEPAAGRVVDERRGPDRCSCWRAQAMARPRARSGCSSASTHASPSRDRGRRRRRTAPKTPGAPPACVADEGSELGLQQRLAALRVERHALAWPCVGAVLRWP